MVMSTEEKKKSQLEANRKYRAKVGCYSQAQKQAIYNYLNKKKEKQGKPPLNLELRKKKLLIFKYKIVILTVLVASAKVVVLHITLFKHHKINNVASHK